MTPSARQILIVDDTPDNIKVIAAMLRKGGYDISFANSGPQALDIISLTPPDLILLDIMMPEMDGFDVCQRIKSDVRTSGIPVIFLSNLTDTSKVVRGLKLGAVDYLNKPVEKEILLARVNTHLTMRSLQKDLELKVRERTEALNRTHQQLNDILVSMPSVVIGLDSDCRVMHWNPRAEERTGISQAEAAGRTIDALLSHPAVTRDTVAAVMRTGQTFRDSRVSDRSAEVRYEDITIYALANRAGVVVYMEDVTDQVRLEEMMIQSEKMMSLGGLAAGIAHEINNPLAGMTQTAELLEKMLTEDLETGGIAPGRGQAGLIAPGDLIRVQAYVNGRNIPKLLANIRASGHQAARIINNMLSFARSSNGRIVNCRVPRLMDEILDTALSAHHPAQRFDAGNIRFTRNYQAGLPRIPCDPATLQQVFFNILQNGIYALNAHKEAGGPDYAPAVTISVAMAGDGNEVEISIRDNGPGIAPGLEQKIFDPFFTTKPPGIGTGLGLSISYYIITQAHNGALSVRSSPGRGACFTIRLPAVPLETPP